MHIPRSKLSQARKKFLNWKGGAAYKKFVNAQYISQKGNCLNCGIRMYFLVGTSKIRFSMIMYETQPSIDHVVPLSEGGDPVDPKNMRIICWKCNKFINTTKQKLSSIMIIKHTKFGDREADSKPRPVA